MCVDTTNTTPMYGGIDESSLEIKFWMNIISTSGKHCTLVSNSKYVGTCLDAAQELAGIGVECEVGIEPLDVLILVWPKYCGGQLW